MRPLIPNAVICFEKKGRERTSTTRGAATAQDRNSPTVADYTPGSPRVNAARENREALREAVLDGRTRPGAKVDEEKLRGAIPATFREKFEKVVAEKVGGAGRNRTAE